MARDGAYEETWRDHLSRRVSALYDVSIAHLDRMVVARLNLGKARNGDNDFMDKDMVHEALEETADCVVYALLEAQKRIANGCPQGLEDLEQAAIHAAMADHYFRRAGRAVDSA